MSISTIMLGISILLYSSFKFYRACQQNLHIINVVMRDIAGLSTHPNLSTILTVFYHSSCTYGAYFVLLYSFVQQNKKGAHFGIHIAI